ncbi:MAG: hypothetical protein OK449_05695 [Thaumarchaeota archaeon]|nr:hypothetical protein [Nitrososphaerota archaeon]
MPSSGYVPLAMPLTNAPPVTLATLGLCSFSSASTNLQAPATSFSVGW